MSNSLHPPTLPEYGDAFLSSAAGSQPRTRRTYRVGLARLQAFAEEKKLTPAGQPLPAAAVYRELLSHFYVWLTDKKKYRPDTLQLYLGVARHFVSWLGGLGHLPPGLSPEALKQSLLSTAGQKPAALRRRHREADDKVGALLDHYAARLAATPDDADHRRLRLILLRDQALLQVLYATAGRAAEVAQLTRSNVAEGNATQIQIVGKGEKKRPLLLTEPAQQAIQAYLAARRAASPGGMDPHPGLFISHGRAAGQSLTTRTIWEIVNQASKAVFGEARYRTKPKKEGVKARYRTRALVHIGPHAFRHLRAQHLADEGMPLETIQALLGHADISTTRAIYAPRTKPELLLDQVRTYGRDPAVVARAGHALARHEARVRPAPKVKKRARRTE